jgi:hypothetical protein
MVSFVKFVSVVIDPTLPIIFTGDFNISAGSQYHSVLLLKLNSQFPGILDASRRIGSSHVVPEVQNGTLNLLGYSGSKIDYIFLFKNGHPVEQKYDFQVITRLGANYVYTPIPHVLSGNPICVGGRCFPDHKILYAEFTWN